MTGGRHGRANSSRHVFFASAQQPIVRCPVHSRMARPRRIGWPSSRRRQTVSNPAHGVAGTCGSTGEPFLISCRRVARHTACRFEVDDAQHARMSGNREGGEMPQRTCHVEQECRGDGPMVAARFPGIAQSPEKLVGVLPQVMHQACGIGLFFRTESDREPARTLRNGEEMVPQRFRYARSVSVDAMGQIGDCSHHVEVPAGDRPAGSDVARMRLPLDSSAGPSPARLSTRIIANRHGGRHAYFGIAMSIRITRP